MEHEVMPFYFQEQQVRAVRQADGTVWFVAKDVFDALGIVWKRADSLQSIPESWIGSRKFRPPTQRDGWSSAGEQTLTIISEPAVYKLAFRSRKPEAEKFTNWVASEVLPSLRKTGTYTMPGKEPAPEPDKTEKYLDLFRDSYRVGGHALLQKMMVSCLEDMGMTQAQVFESITGHKMHTPDQRYENWSGMSDVSSPVPDPVVCPLPSRRISADISDAVTVFLSENIITGENLQQHPGNLFRKYEYWCMSMGIKPLTKKAFFGIVLSRFSVEIVKNCGGVDMFQGIALK